jgi:hypothetical protein
VTLPLAIELRRAKQLHGDQKDHVAAFSKPNLINK